MSDLAHSQGSYLLLEEDLQAIESFIEEQPANEKSTLEKFHQHQHPNQSNSTISREYHQNNNNYCVLSGMQIRQEDAKPELHHANLESSEENIQLEEIENFVTTFKQKRVKLGFTQGAVGIALGKLHGTNFSQTIISRFETFSFSYKNILKLKPLLEKWLDEATKSSSDPNSIFNPHHHNHPLNTQRRKKRSSIETKCRAALERAFRVNPKPTCEDLDMISEYTGLTKVVVRVWFSNRRQKARRLGTSSSS